ncbi:hypothetical protein, partial [Stenotrophomonas maltophilia]|uniref:hypothetical protein n=1 Tax=Stenotrophomonas maltophilia TaxID=40324 RepID=UPI001A7E1310
MCGQPTEKKKKIKSNSGSLRSWVLRARKSGRRAAFAFAFALFSLPWVDATEICQRLGAVGSR